MLSRAAVTVAAATAAMLTAQGGAHADPAPGGTGTAGTSGSLTPDDVQRQVDTLYAQSESAGQQADSAQERAAQLQHRASLLQQTMAEEQATANALAARLGEVATEQYQSGSMDPVMQLLFSAHPADYLSRAASLDEVDAGTADELVQLRGVEREIEQGKAEVLAQYSQLEQVRRSISTAKAEAQRRLGAAQALLGSLTAAQRDQLQQAEDASAQLAAQAADGVLPPDQGPADSAAAAALAAARSVLGSPYVYGATGPGAFDCSGLMYWAWRHGGVSLPRTSQEQAFAGRRVPVSEIRPGDLVIYFGDMHHVGMYAGNGMIIHAPYPGARVRYENMRDMPIAAVVRP
ncbi:C40 family peptidase [Streptacidiphilus fuscans]|uniref:C40 family peptidase n=1 Tax=Streptacidiphilus fuscans TaxID=2789292 RepID=A0A931B4N1_9ACTN|nr:C40 family peptidase [Streptacidiphilus fuscans]MBF9071054.1 C40 family peptidase [Streptacidiphilus fuscans]